MKTHLKIDFVSDVVCPWCVIGLKSLEQALERLGDEVSVDLHFQPFELNPQMTADGQDITEHVMQKYGSTSDQVERSREAMRARGAELGITFDMQKRARIYNTFDAHRLLHWAEAEGRQRALKYALFAAYFSEGRNPSDHAVLVDLASQVGLDPVRAKEILASDAYAKDVREQEQHYLNHGIHAVPAVIINDRHLIQGGQPADVFERALRQLANEVGTATH
ncbi:MAG: DsbA family oxidoreductase [Candidatus Obscuribacterales bacterium]|nr:DsbA family oxidoreductase [Steroidobacteraceae bacterium]